MLTHDHYGSDYSFTISQTDAAQTGMTDATYTGVDVAGTINTEAATGEGQALTGNSGESNIDGLMIQYTGSSTGAIGDIKLTQGVAEQMDTKLYYIIDNNDGYLGFKLESINTNIDDIEDDIEFKEDLLAKRMEIFTAKFIAMELFLNSMASLSGWLDGQIKSLK